MKQNFQKALAVLFTALLFPVFLQLGACSSGSKNDFPDDLAKAFSDAGLPLLNQKANPEDFSLPIAMPLGRPQSLSGLKGKVVLLNFWATWCGPCRSEMPSMETLYARHREKGLEILAVNCQEQQSEVLSFMTNNALSFPALLDMDGKVSSTYGIRAIPTSFLLDREGKIILKLTGSINWDTPEIHAAMERLLD